MRDPAENGQLALLLEVAGTPKPGNVDRERDYGDLRFEHFLAGAVGARTGLRAAADGASIGTAFESSIEGMSGQSGGNTQFGALLVTVPLVRAAADGRLTPDGVTETVEATTVEDACAFYEAFEHVGVAVDDPPEGLDSLDVRRGAAATDALRERGATLYDVMALSADRDGVAAEWCSGFERSFEAAGWLLDDEGPIHRRASRAFLRLLAAEPDTFVITRNGETAAEEATRRARAVLDGEADADALAEEFVARDINPGTTADITAGALFVALERGLEV
ncbi:triphosphoribosyl-dephospho-CoA synthase [Natronomonas moolapensis 8.8.11]|uniref:Triphosphoribosyl-dephospho-CoA synthase n=1 Tax=Natronomonas moolapensis (strain DSM 18674 / CECT 7526 / JCM 14361 / 8.8.11) TaxID=268739 RepID=M1XT49_NATM8|nr:triphosphoribosyl-dephospho-CoA synthase [Natronomonas moolapensis]CCQ37583.1 triphosphoribosyl-dephospho-CoA synthase [Natronomonas moolapensis 8.8.11]